MIGGFNLDGLGCVCMLNKPRSNNIIRMLRWCSADVVALLVEQVGTAQMLCVLPSPAFELEP